MRKKSLVSMVAAMGLVAAIGVGATLAFLSAETKTLTNTFTFTDQGIDLRLDEAKVVNSMTKHWKNRDQKEQKFLLL